MSGRRRQYPIETKPFFLTSEFVGTLLAIIALACTAAAMPNLGAPRTWILVTAMLVSYAISRGLAKAATRSYAFDPRERLLQRDGGGSNEPPAGAGVAYGTETKPSFLTSEFLGTLFAIIALAISTAVIDSLNVRLGWTLIAALVCGYVLSRGVAKIGVKSHSLDPREQMLRPERERAQNEQTTVVR
jgi:cobalamin synthase